MWIPYALYGILGFMGLWLLRHRLLYLKVRNWVIYLLLYSFFVALFTCTRADALVVLAEHWDVHLFAPVIMLFAHMLSFFHCYRDSFKDIPLEHVRNADSVANAVQIVRSLSFEVRVLLLT